MFADQIISAMTARCYVIRCSHCILFSELFVLECIHTFIEATGVYVFSNISFVLVQFCFTFVCTLLLKYVTEYNSMVLTLIVNCTRIRMKSIFLKCPRSRFWIEL